jgi:heme/copper-type cytochrome/quinol oxidase subunit 2
LSFDSFIKLEDDLVPGDYRLLSVDRPLVVPYNVVIRFCVTSADVIHRFSLPSARIKVDAVPGIINVVSVKFSRIGVYYGQCSEICGSLHSFIPIQIEVCL